MKCTCGAPAETGTRCNKCKNVALKKRQDRKQRLLGEGLCKRCGDVPHLAGMVVCEACAKRRAADAKRWPRRWGKDTYMAVLRHYGAVCVCCGESDERFLTLDHKNNDGAEQRRTHGKGYTYYKRLITLGFPDDHRVMCYNCNMGRARNGGVCPHQEINEQPV